MNNPKLVEIQKIIKHLYGVSRLSTDPDSIWMFQDRLTKGICFAIFYNGELNILHQSISVLRPTMLFYEGHVTEAGEALLKGIDPIEILIKEDFDRRTHETKSNFESDRIDQRTTGSI